MSDRKPCIRCDRSIDAYARICPFCNWDQNETSVPVATAAPAIDEGPVYQPPPDRSWQKPVFLGAGGVVVIIAMFFVGSWLQDRKTADTRVGKVETPAPAAPVKTTPRANVLLVPDNGPVGDQPITSAPAAQQAEGVPIEYQRTDATAASSEEYAAMAQRAEAERRRMAALVDPRTVRTPTDLGTPPPARRQPMQLPPMTSAAPAAPAVNVIRTRPVPEYQPLPAIRVHQNVTAVLDLVIGPDGRVKDVNIRNPLPGETPKLIAAVQSWRFKPATENGRPVAAPFTVDITFKTDE